MPTVIRTEAPDDGGEVRIGQVATALAKIHDELVQDTAPEVYVAVSASWQTAHDKLMSVTVSSSMPDDEDDEAAQE